jgi:hypothetical protein
MDVVTFKAVWSGAQATNGDFSIDVSDDQINWYSLDFGQAMPLDGAIGSSHMIISEIGFKFLRCSYSQSNPSATGLLNITVFATDKAA